MPAGAAGAGPPRPPGLVGDHPRRRPVQLQRPGDVEISGPAAGRGRSARPCSTRSSATTSRFSGPVTASGPSAATRAPRSTAGTPSRSGRSRSRSPRRASRTRCCPGCPPRSTRSPATRRRSAGSAARCPAGQLARLPGPGVPDRLPGVRHPVPSRAGRGWTVHPDRRLQARRVLPARAGGRAQGPGLPQQRRSRARRPAPVRPHLRPGRRARAGPRGPASRDGGGQAPSFPPRASSRADWGWRLWRPAGRAGTSSCRTGRYPAGTSWPA